MNAAAAALRSNASTHPKCSAAAWWNTRTWNAPDRPCRAGPVRNGVPGASIDKDNIRRRAERGALCSARATAGRRVAGFLGDQLHVRDPVRGPRPSGARRGGPRRCGPQGLRLAGASPEERRRVGRALVRRGGGAVHRTSQEPGDPDRLGACRLASCERSPPGRYRPRHRPARGAAAGRAMAPGRRSGRVLYVRDASLRYVPRVLSAVGAGAV